MREEPYVTRALAIWCVAIVALIVFAMSRLATSIPLAIAATGLTLLGPVLLVLPVATVSLTLQDVVFASVSVVAGIAFVAKPNPFTSLLAAIGFVVWCLCGFGIVTSGY